jgi:putative nucleotidyltransferase with HDIG domain
MRFATRAFAFCFVPFALLLGISFWALQSMVQSNVRDQLRSEMRNEQTTRARIHRRSEAQVGRFLRFAGENAALKAGLQILNTEPESRDARRTVEDQLGDLSAQIGFNLLSVSNVNGAPVAWVLRERNSAPASRDRDVLPPSPVSTGRRLVDIRGNLYHLFSVPIDQGNENLGDLTVGERLDLSDFGVPVVLFHGNRMIRSTLNGISAPRIEAAFGHCSGRPECQIQLDGASYLSFEMQDTSLGPGYALRSLQNVDAAAAPVQASLREVFFVASVGAVFAAFFFSAGASLSLVRPLAEMLAQLKKSEREGMLAEIPADTRIIEVRELIRSFNRAAASIRDARGHLQAAYVEFVGSLANALDARDRYTAGHSQRVSQIALSIAETLKLSPEEQEVIRVGALLHDIGKIGIPDAVLQKPGALSDAEFTLIKQHPTIGVRILEGVNGLTAYLPSVEFHHENWDGSGYPRGLREYQIPLAARIIHVADAWDAMTSDRPYRTGFSHARALSVLTVHAGKHFDPEIASIFIRMIKAKLDEDYLSILRLSSAVGENSTVPALELTQPEHV